MIQAVVPFIALALALRPSPMQSDSTAAAVAAPVVERRERVDAGEVAAQAGDDVVTWEELDNLLLARHALGPVAEEPLSFLAQSALIRTLGAQAGITVAEADVEARYAELDRRTLESGVEGGLAGHLERSGVSRAEFMSALHDQLTLAELTRRALGLTGGKPASDQEQQLWLDQQIGTRKLERLQRPWQDDVVARLGEVDIRGRDLAARLRNAIGGDKLRDTLFQLMLAKRVDRECAALPEEIRRAAVELEVVERRAESENNPRYQGVSFDALLRAQGLDPESYANDPSVRIAALSTLIVDTRYPGAQLEETYKAEKEWFDGQFGESIHALIVFVPTSEQPDGITKFTREQARVRMRDLAASVESEPAFAAAAARLKQDESDGISASDLGSVYRQNPRLDAELRDTVFRLHREGVHGTSAPIEFSTGVGLLFIGAHRPSPPFAELRDEVHTEMRRRLLVGALPAQQLVTFVDPRAAATAR